MSELLSEHANVPEFDIATDDVRALARRELREWIRRGLLVERGGAILATAFRREMPILSVDGDFQDYAKLIPIELESI